MRLLFVLAALCFALPAHAVTIDWVEVGDRGNACDVQPPSGSTPGGCFGSVDYVYWISKYEITNAHYTEFLNAVAATDTNELYDEWMGSGYGGITRSGSPGSYSYSAIYRRRDMPVIWVSFWDALRFANWLHNGQLSGAQDNSTTEDGAYTITPGGIAENSITRNAEGTIFLTSEDEWYKAAYFDGTSHLDYPAGSNSGTHCTYPGSEPNTANCSHRINNLIQVGSYTGSASPYGTFDQGGNVSEWNESIILGSHRGFRGGNFYSGPSSLTAGNRDRYPPYESMPYIGFRVAMIPEPTTALLLACGLAGLAAAGRRRLHSSWLILAAATVLFAAGESARAVTLNDLDRIRLVTHTTTGERVTLKPAALPYANTSVSSDGGTQAITEYDLSSDAFSISFDHTREGTYQSLAMSSGDIYFTVDQQVNYTAPGSYTAVDPDGRRVFFEASLIDETPGPSAGTFVFRSVQISNSTPNEEFTLGMTDGDTYNDSAGLLAGALIPNRHYRYTYNVHIEAWPSASPSGGTALGSLLLSFTPIPEPTTALLLGCGLLGLAAAGRRQRS